MLKKWLALDLVYNTRRCQREYRLTRHFAFLFPRNIFHSARWLSEEADSHKSCMSIISSNYSYFMTVYN